MYCVRLDQDRFDSLRIILDPGESSSIVIGKHTQKSQNKINKPVHWSTQGGDFQKNYTTNVEIILPELDAMKIMT